jgi:hypothetical protein
LAARRTGEQKARSGLVQNRPTVLAGVAPRTKSGRVQPESSGIGILPMIAAVAILVKNANGNLLLGQWHEILISYQARASLLLGGTNMRGR